MRSAMILPLPTRGLRPVMVLLVWGVCLVGCDSTVQQGAGIALATTAAPASPPHPTATPSTFEADDALAIATARDQAARAAREQTLRVQRQLVEQRRAARDAAQHGNGNERCLDGQKMRRVANGWVQAGAC